LLTDPSNPYLFPSRGLKHRAGPQLGELISHRVWKRLGIRNNLHLFSHLAAKLYLQENPGRYGVVQKLLGHRNIATTIKFYCGTEHRAALKHFDEHVELLQKKLGQLVRPPGSRRSGRGG